MEQATQAAEALWPRAWWRYVDALRRRQGELLDQLGWGPQTAPARLVRRLRTVELLAFHDARATGPTLLIVPAPIKTWYIWDLAEDISVVRRCLRQGLRVYLTAWCRPEPDDEEMGLSQYADELLFDCLNTIGAETGQARAFLAGHSLGGTLAAIFTSLHAEQVEGLVEIEGPIEFDPEAGRLEAAVLESPAASFISEMVGNIPGSFLDLASCWADPLTFAQEPLTDWFESLPFPRRRRIYQQVRRWTLDETPMPRRLFEDVVEQLYRRDRFARGTLDLASRRADPLAIVAPIAAVVDPRSHIVPPASVAAYRKCTGSPDVRLFEYDGDVGVMLQHVGVLVGDNAHAALWPRIVDWIHEIHCGAAKATSSVN
jgi:polyhydroxyalkanoate synthase